MWYNIEYKKNNLSETVELNVDSYECYKKYLAGNTSEIGKKYDGGTATVVSTEGDKLYILPVNFKRAKIVEGSGPHTSGDVYWIVYGGVIRDFTDNNEIIINGIAIKKYDLTQEYLDTIDTILFNRELPVSFSVACEYRQYHSIMGWGMENLRVNDNEKFVKSLIAIKQTLCPDLMSTLLNGGTIPRFSMYSVLNDVLHKIKNYEQKVL